jgi:hypothetical protein
MTLEELADKYAEVSNSTQEAHRIEILRRQAASEIAAAEATARTANYTRRMVFWIMISAVMTAVSAIATPVAAFRACFS